MPRDDWGADRGRGQENNEIQHELEQRVVQKEVIEPVKPVVPSIKPAETKPNVPEISAELKAHIERANQEREQAKKHDTIEDPEGIRSQKKITQTSEISDSLNVDWLDKKII